jgi:peptidoglycan/xylan/chitin deacetylase (PgdA/CDA1 family)
MANVWRPVVLLLALLLAATSARAADPDRQIAVTFDDLPWASLDPNTPLPPSGGSVPADIRAQSTKLLADIRAAGTPATGFVNESRLLAHGQLQDDRVAMLDAWLDAGLELGNHTASHLDLHAVGLPAYERDVLLGEQHLRPLLARHGQVPRWFRHPFLRTGRSAAEKAAFTAFLTAHGYRIAPVTITSSDWLWAAAYARTLGSGDTATQARLRDDYLAYMLRTVVYFEGRSRALLGRELPQVLLLHANALNADSYAALVAALRARGYRFITLDEAMRDPAYLRPDGYVGPLGTSWIHRWALAAGRSWMFYNGEPTSPRWVLDLAGIASE